MWWKLIVEYIKKVFRYLMYAATLALITWAVFPMLSLPILALMYFINCARVSLMILRPMPAPLPRAMLAIFWFYKTVLYSYDVILLLSATPYFQVTLAIAVFFHVFEFVVPSNYSLIRLLFNPETRQSLINDLRHTNGSQYLTPTDLIQQDQSGTNYQKFAMNHEELEALRSRQRTAISNLPEALKQLHATQKNNPEPKNHYKGYCATLTKNQEKALEHYLEIRKTIAESSCPLTLRAINDPDSNLSDFVILEKHYYQDDKYYAVPGGADVFIITEDLGTCQNGLRPLMNQSSIDRIENPTNRDKLLRPRTHTKSNNTTEYSCRYVHYPLEFIEAHPLTLELCEAIEAFNLSLDLQPNSSISSHLRVLFRQPSKAQASERPVNPIAPRLNLEDVLKDGMSDEELTQILLTSYAH